MYYCYYQDNHKPYRRLVFIQVKHHNKDPPVDADGPKKKQKHFLFNVEMFCIQNLATFDGLGSCILNMKISILLCCIQEISSRRSFEVTSNTCLLLLQIFYFDLQIYLYLVYRKQDLFTYHISRMQGAAFKFNVVVTAQICTCLILNTTEKS